MSVYDIIGLSTSRAHTNVGYILGGVPSRNLGSLGRESRFIVLIVDYCDGDRDTYESRHICMRCLSDLTV